VPRPSEQLVFVETRPALSPKSHTRLCIRSLAPVSATCSSSTSAAAPVTNGISPPSTDPASFIFNTTEGLPYGPCLELSADDSSAALYVERPPPDDCWPGGGYCSEFATTWNLTRSPGSSNSQLLFDLQIVRTWATYQDTDGSRGTVSASLTFQLVDGCVFKLHANNVTRDPGTSFCMTCSGSRVTLASVASSKSCVRCPSRSSRAAVAASASKMPTTTAAPAPAANSWQCISGLPKGFESIAVRMGPGGNPECASSNGRTCLRNLGTASTCSSMLPLLYKLPVTVAGQSSAGRSVVQVLQPLACGAHHKKQWGITGYDTAGHWCNIARDWLQDRQSKLPGACVAKP
jgi:hypothetical protein